MIERKTIKVTIPADKVTAFYDAKAEAECAVMMAMTDTQYASRLIQWAIDQQSCASVSIKETDNSLVIEVTGKPGTERHRQACIAAELLEQSLEV